MEEISYKITIVGKSEEDDFPLFRIDDRALNMWTDNFLIKVEAISGKSLLKEKLSPDNLYLIESGFDKGSERHFEEVREHIKNICTEILNGLEKSDDFKIKSPLTNEELEWIHYLDLDAKVSKIYSNSPNDVGHLKMEVIRLIDKVTAKRWEKLLCFQIAKSWSNYNQEDDDADILDKSTFVLVDKENYEIWLLILNLYLEQ